ncbi:MAG: hypothetical protein QMC38_00955 [Sinobacterium sp.]
MRAFDVKAMTPPFALIFGSTTTPFGAKPEVGLVTRTALSNVGVLIVCAGVQDVLTRITITIELTLAEMYFFIR